MPDPWLSLTAGSSPDRCRVQCSCGWDADIITGAALLRAAMHQAHCPDHAPAPRILTAPVICPRCGCTHTAQAAHA